MNTHYFTSCGDAYSASNTGINLNQHAIEIGDTLVIFEDADIIVGISWAWPVAVTANFGKPNKSIHSVMVWSPALIEDLGGVGGFNAAIRVAQNLQLKLCNEITQAQIEAAYEEI